MTATEASADVPCVATGDPATGSTCALTTSYDALTPNILRAGKRAVVALGHVRVYDGGPDGDPATAGNSLFMTQGLFIP
jgi:hypothetical protein